MADQVRAAWPFPPPHYKEAAGLEPPPIPPDTNLHVYGYRIQETYKTQIDDLNQELPLLYTPADINTKTELKKLNMSLLFNFLDLVESLVSDPTQYEDGVKNIETLLMNLHHLLNTFRPHQARETVISVLEQQIERRKAFLVDLEAKIAVAKKNLDTAKTNLSKVDLSSQ